MTFKAFLTLVVVVTLPTVAGAQTKTSGTSVCGKPDQQQALEVGDRTGHSLSISQGKCTWTKPMEIAGTQTKEDLVTFSDDVRGSQARGFGYVVGTMVNGDKFFVRIQGSTVLKDGAPQSAEGKWNFTGGTGKLKGIKGGGTYKGTAGAEGVTYEVEGEYQLPSK